jgi:tetratricopeptide (TPR) repeat protein
MSADNKDFLDWKIFAILTLAILIFIPVGVYFGNKNNEENYQQSIILIKEKKWQEASEKLKMLGDFKDSQNYTKIANYELNMELGKKYLDKKEYSNAKNAFQIAFDLQPENSDAKSYLEKSSTLLDEQNKSLEKKKKAAELVKIKENMDYYEGDLIQIAVFKIKMSKSTDSHIALKNNRFVYIGIATRNNSTGIIPVNPNDFTLSTSDGYTVSHDSDTYSLDNYFDAVDLPSSGTTSGWLIFCLPKDTQYTLHYNGFEDKFDKKIVVN